MRFALVLLSVFLLSVPVQAHDSGESFEAVIDGYMVDIGYSTETPTTDDVVAFDFQLTKDKASVVFSDVWVKIEDEHKVVVFAGGLHNAQFGGARMSYRFPDAGSYTISVRYESGDVRFAEVVVPMTVTEGVPDTSSDNRMFIGAAAIFLIGVAGALAWHIRRKVSP